MKINRRDLLVLGGAAVLGVGCNNHANLKIPATASYDEVIDALFRTDFEFDFGTNHGPMVADALVEAGRPERIAAWVEEYSKDLLLLPRGSPLSPAERASALDHYELRSRWVATYEVDLESLSPRELLVKEWPKLRDGIIGSLWHGIIRTGHAVRALDREDTPIRRKEFAYALAYWAVRVPAFAAVPGSRPMVGQDVGTALAGVALVPASERKAKGTIEAKVSVVNGQSSFTDSIETVDLRAFPIERGFTELVAAAARMFVNDGLSPLKNNTLWLHAITGTAAVRLLLPWFDAAMQEEALGAAFLALAATHATQTAVANVLDPVPPPIESSQMLFARAFASDDVHHIKLGEAVAREVAIEMRPELLTALERLIALRV